MKPWRLLAISSLCSLASQSFAILMPLPPVPDNGSTSAPAATDASAALVGKNSAKTQALLDQLFNKADYKDFAEQTPFDLTFGESP